MIPTDRRILLCKRIIAFMSKQEKWLKRSNGLSVTSERICQPVRTKQVCAEHKCFPCCLIGQLAMCNFVECVLKKAGDH